MKMKRNDRITESKLRNIILESVRKTINEIDLETSIRAEDASEYWSGQLRSEFDNFKNAACDLYEVLINRQYPHENFNKEKWVTSNTQGDRLAWEVMKIVDKVENFVERKEKQYTRFAQNSDEKYVERFGANDKEMSDSFDPYVDKYGWDTMDDPEWRKENLTPQQQDYWDFREKNYGGI
jgi:hypothetical protein